MTAVLTLSVDRTSGGFQPAELRLRVRGPDGEVLAQDPLVTGIELSPPDLVTVAAISDTTPGVLAYTCQVDTEALGRDGALVSGGTRTVTMTIRALPGDGHQQPLVATCPIEVVVPAPTIHWSSNGDPTTADRPVRLEATEGSEFTLHVQLERFSAEHGRVTTVDDAMFSHMVNVGPGGQTAYTYQVFGVHPDARPWEAPPGSRAETSRWLLQTELPPEGRPELAAPSTTFIRVRAWPAGSITERHPDRIVVSETKLAECFVPVEFVPVEVTAELIDTPMPIPADGHRVELVVALRRAGSDQPATGVPVTLALRHHADADGSLDPATTAVTSDDQGLVHVGYTTPALTYRAGGRYLEELVVTRTGDGSTEEIAVFPLHLNPELRAELNVAKDGLEFETVHIHRPAGRTPAMVAGNLSLTVENRLVRARQTSPVAHAEATLLPEGTPAEAGGVAATDAPRCHSGDDGAIGFTLTELSEGWAAAAEAHRRDVEGPLDAEREIPAGRFDADVTLVIDQYDVRIEQSSWWLEQCRLPTKSRMDTQRLTLGDQLARRPETDLPRVISGTLLLHRASHIPRIVDTRYRLLWKNVGEHLGQIFDALISMANTFFDVTDKLMSGAKTIAGSAVSALQQTIGPLLQTVGSGLTSMMQEAIAQLQHLVQAAAGVAPGLTTTLQQMMQNATSMLDSIRQMLHSTGLDGVSKAIEHLSSVSEELAAVCRGIGDALLDLATFLVEALAGVGQTLIKSLSAFFPWAAGIADEAFDHALTTLQPVIDAARQSTTFTKGLDTLIGKYFQKMVDMIVGLIRPPVSGRIAELLKNQMGAAFPRSGSALDVLLDHVDRLAVPEDPEPSLHQARQRASWIQQIEAGSAVASARINDVLNIADIVFMVAKVLLASVKRIASAKVVVALPFVQLAEMKLMKALDLAWSAIKGAAIHLPVAVANAVFAWATLELGFLTIADMAAGPGGSSGSSRRTGGSSGSFGRSGGASGNFLEPAGGGTSW